MDFTSSLERYINLALATSVTIELCQKGKQLPFFLQDLYQMYEMVLLDQKCIILFGKSSESSPASIEKQVNLVEKKLGMPAIYACESISSYERSKLVQHQVPFIIPDNQLFLPFLGVCFREKFLVNYANKSNSLSMSATVVLVYMLRSNKNEFELNNLADATGYTKMTISRSANELEHFNIIKSEIAGRKRLLSLVNCKKSTIDFFLHLLKSPVYERLYFEVNAIDLSSYLRSGYDALGLLSDLNESDIPIVAIDIHSWKKLQKTGIRAVKHGDICMEIWAIDPALFSNNGAVNPILLGISLKDDLDVRVKECAINAIYKELTSGSR